MNKVTLLKPVLIMLYGFPGSGKTFFARQLSEVLHAAHVSSDRIRGELFENPKRTKEENGIVTHLMDYMTEEFLNAGISVIYDGDVTRLTQRRALRDLARKTKANFALTWLQIDAESAYMRTQGRDRRKADDKYALPIDKGTFAQLVGVMQNPHLDEEYIVISGKHTFNAQKAAVFKKLHELGLIETTEAISNVPKPGMVNLVPNHLGGRVDASRRNIVIR